MTQANSINVDDNGLVKFDSTNKFTSVPVTEYSVLVGGASNDITSVAPSSAGQVLASNGATSDPSFQDVADVLPEGAAGTVLQGQGVGSAPAYSTATYPATAGTSGNVLTSDGTDWSSQALPASTDYSAYAPWIVAAAADSTANYTDLQTAITAAHAVPASPTAPKTLFLKTGNYGAGGSYTQYSGVNLIGPDPMISSPLSGGKITYNSQYSVKIAGYFSSGGSGTNCYANLLIRSSAISFSAAVNIVENCRISSASSNCCTGTSYFTNCQIEGGLDGTTYVDGCYMSKGGNAPAACIYGGTANITNSYLTDKIGYSVGASNVTATIQNSYLDSCLCNATNTLTLINCTIIGGVTALINGTASTVKCVNCSDGTNKITDGTYPAATPENQVLYSDSSYLQQSLTNGTTGQVLTATTSAAPSWKNPSAPYAGGIVTLVDDFIGAKIVASNLMESVLSWEATTIGFLPDSAIGADSGHPGMLGNSASSSISSLFLGDSSIANYDIFALGGGALTVTWYFKVQVLSTTVSSKDYILRLGIGDTTGGDQANGCYFEYRDGVNSAQWQYKTAAASTRTTGNSSTAVTQAWHKAQIVVNAGATSVEFFMDDVSLGTSSTNIPTANITPFMEMIPNGSQAANSIYVDLFTLSQTLTTAR